MFANESQARMALTAASEKLEAATREYAAARKKLNDITGEFAAQDTKVSLQYTAADGKAKTAHFHLTDC